MESLASNIGFGQTSLHVQVRPSPFLSTRVEVINDVDFLLSILDSAVTANLICLMR